MDEEVSAIPIEAGSVDAESSGKASGQRADSDLPSSTHATAQKGAVQSSSVQSSSAEMAAGSTPGPESHFGLPLEVFFWTVEQSPVAISITDPRANIVYVNAAFEAVTGYDRGQLLGRNQSMLSDQRTPSIVYESLWSSLLRQRPWKGKLVNRRSDGTPYLAELTVAPVTDQQCNTRYFLGMHRDVTEQHVLEQAVRNQKALIDSLLDSAPMWFVAIDEKGQVALSNAPYRAAATRYDTGDLAQVFVRALCGDDPARFAQLRDKKSPIEPREIEVPFQDAVGARRVELVGQWLDENDSSADAFFRRGGQRYFLVFGTDVTSLREQQERVAGNALRELITEEERVQELQEVLNAAMFRFELPLNLLNVALRSSERRGHDEQSFQTLQQAVREAVAEGQALLERLRHSVPELPESPIEEIDLSELVREVLKLSTARLMAEDIVVDVSLPNLPTLRAKRGQLRVLFKELIDNAIEAMGSSAERGIFVEAAVDAGQLVFSISDTGPGIPESLHFKVFEPFFSRTMHKRDGAGMGLSRVQNIVTDHRGTAYVDPSYKKGCRIKLELPLDSPD